MNENLHMNGRFAQLQTKYGIAKLLLNYELSVSSKMELPVKMKKTALTMEVDGGIWLDYKKIK